MSASRTPNRKKYNIDYFRENRLVTAQYDFDKYKETSLFDVFVEHYEKGIIDNLDDVDWSLFTKYLYEKKNIFGSIYQIVSSPLLEESVRKIKKPYKRSEFLRYIQLHAENWFSKSVNIISYANFENDCLRLYREATAEQKIALEEDEVRMSAENARLKAMTRQLKKSLEEEQAKLEREKITKQVEDRYKAKLEEIRLQYEEKIAQLNKRIEQLTIQQKLTSMLVVGKPSDIVLDLDSICEYAKESLDRAERRIVSHLLLSILENPSKEIKEKIKELDKKTPLEAEKVVLGDEVQTKIVKHE